MNEKNIEKLIRTILTIPARDKTRISRYFFRNLIIAFLLSNKKKFLSLFDGKLRLNNRVSPFDRDVKNFIYSLTKILIKKISKEYFEKGMTNLAINAMMKNKYRREEFKNKYGFEPPSFLTISPTLDCNLSCKGCYAASPGRKLKNFSLNYSVVNRVIEEGEKLFGMNFFVLSGGEPLMYKSDGKNLLDLVENHENSFFLMYTNGILINEEIAEKMSKLGNISPAISIEGLEKETDERRGKGIFRKILNVIDLLREKGVVYGISVTATRENSYLIASEEFWNFWKNKDIGYAWIFHYMPMGSPIQKEKPDPRLMPTPEQRKELYFMQQRLNKSGKIAIADFWNGGCMSGGCISAGVHGGYFFIDPLGIYPCVFNQFLPREPELSHIYRLYLTNNSLSLFNIKDYYGNDIKTLEKLLTDVNSNKRAIRAIERGYGLNLVDAINSEWFRELRNWIEKRQKINTYKNQGSEAGLLQPCIIRDHPKIHKEIVKKTDAIPSITMSHYLDQDIQRKMGDYSKKVEKTMLEVWEKRYLNPLLFLSKFKDFLPDMIKKKS